MNKQQIFLDELRRLEFNLLTMVVSICDANQLRYYLGYGTLLGAVRHKGFIPWDDDIDILMPRPDYLRLIEIIDQGNFANMKMLSLQNEKDYFYPFAKLIDTRTILYLDCNQTEEVELGVNIDIFPLDGLPENIHKSNILLITMYVLRIIWAVSNKKFPHQGKTWYIRLVKMVLAVFFKPFGYKRVLRVMDYFATRYAYDSSNYIGCVVWGEGPQERINRKYFTNADKLEFEGKQFVVPYDYDRYLSNIYGDYMQLPPENERISQHKWQAYWK